MPSNRRNPPPRLLSADEQTRDRPPTPLAELEEPNDRRTSGVAQKNGGSRLRVVCLRVLPTAGRTSIVL
jgi:hypothetical protein